MKDKPLVVGGKSDQRGVVAAASYPARKFGIHSAMSMYQAEKRCPELIIRPPRFKAYKTYSRIVMGILRNLSPVMQQVSVDEAYLDLTDQIRQWHQAEAELRDVQQKISRDIGLSASVGLSTSKMIAKIASDMDKPAGFTVVHPGAEIGFLEPLPVNKIPGIGPKSVHKLANIGVNSIKDLAQIPEIDLATKFGKWGREMYYWARGIDERPVHEEKGAKSISTERTFNKDIANDEELHSILKRQSEQVSSQLKRAGYMGRTISIKIRYADFETFTRQMSLNRYTDRPSEIFIAAVELFRKSWISGSPVRLLGVGVSNFATPERQLSLNI